MIVQASMARCRKCSSSDVAVTFHAAGCNRTRCTCAKCSYDSHEKRHDEHLHYRCRFCGFDWTGDTIDWQREGGWGNP